MPVSRRLRPRVAVDTKNFALYAGGIAAHFRPLLAAWVAAWPNVDFVLVGPPFELGDLGDFPNCRRHVTPWPAWLPRQLRHPVYDNVAFPRAIAALRPDAVMSPYHDVRLPADVPSVMMLHDTCIHDLPDVYPRLHRRYFLQMLSRNLSVAGHIVTLSQASFNRVQAVYGVDATRVSIVPSALEPRLAVTPESQAAAAELRSARGLGLHIFYSGGAEYRKNVGRLVEAIHILRTEGSNAHLWTTGRADAGWEPSLSRVTDDTRAAVHFLGRVDLDELNRQYQAADVVAYPTLCEGFGRVVLEAMQLGVPVACSDLAVSREVAGDYPVYFDPRDARAIAHGLLQAAQRLDRVPQHRPEYLPEAVAERFIRAMDTALRSVVT